MTNPNKAKGSAWEREVTNYLQSRGLHANRMPAGATLDKGDISLEDWTVEAKNLASISLPSILAEAVAEQKNAGTKYHVATIKRRGVGPAPTAYALMTIEQWVDIALELKELAELRKFKEMFVQSFNDKPRRSLPNYDENQ